MRDYEYKHHPNGVIPKPKVIWLLYTSDAEGENEKLLVAATARKRLKKALVRAVHNDLITYGENVADCSESKVLQLRRLRKDFEALPRDEFNALLRYGRIDYCYDGEEI